MKRDYKTKAREIVEAAIERENEYFNKQEPGTDEYVDSQKRLCMLQDKLAELDKGDIETKGEFKKFILECVKIGVSIVIPVFGLVVITAQEREITYTSALKSLIMSCFGPSKRI